MLFLNQKAISTLLPVAATSSPTGTDYLSREPDCITWASAVRVEHRGHEVVGVVVGHASHGGAGGVDGTAGTSGLGPPLDPVF